MSEVEETIQRIKNLSKVEGIIIMNNEGLTIRSTFTGTKKEDGELYAKNVFQLSLKAKSIIRDLEPTVNIILIFIIFIIFIYFIYLHLYLYIYIYLLFSPFIYQFIIIYIIILLE